MKRKAIWRVAVNTSSEAEDAVSALLGEIFSTSATSYTDAENGVTTVSVFLGKSPHKSPHWREELRRGLKHIRACGLTLGTGRCAISRLKAENWAESWKRHFKPLGIGNRLLVKPSWSRRRARGGQAEVVLDPGLSFGTGQHPTTHFCLQELVVHLQPGKAQSFLDVGTGSGILAICAAKLGYARVDAFDFDPEAVRIARQNAKANGVHRKIHFSQADVRRLPQRGRPLYSLVCANLQADLLLAECPRLVAQLSDGGLLVLAGILRKEFGHVRRAYEAAGLRMVATEASLEWQSASFRLARRMLIKR